MADSEHGEESRSLQRTILGCIGCGGAGVLGTLLAAAVVIGLLSTQLDGCDFELGPGKGTASKRLAVRVAPATGLTPYVISNARMEPDASNTMYLSFYTPLQLSEATENRAPFPIEAQTEFGGNVYSALVTVPAGGTRTITFNLSGTVSTGREYHLDLFSQPMIEADGVRVQVHSDDPNARIVSAEGLTVVGDKASLDTTVTDDRRLSVTFAPRN